MTTVSVDRATQLGSLMDKKSLIAEYRLYSPRRRPFGAAASEHPTDKGLGTPSFTAA
jgi:hypothetical protein